MPSEQRLHPATLLFDVVRHLRNLALPAVLVILGVTRSSAPFDGVPRNWEVWLLLPLVPALMVSAARYLSFRLRYDESELVIRSGLVFRNERHIPFSRIQNLDAAQNPLHRLFGVVEVRVETGGGKDEEARLSVLPRAAFDRIREHVFAFKSRGAGEGASALPVEAAAAAADRRVEVTSSETLLHLPLRELLLCGFLENKGLVLVGAAYGLMWQNGVDDFVWSLANTFGGGVLRDVFAAIFIDRSLAIVQVILAMMGLAVLLLLVRLLSMAWAFVRLYDFTLTRVGDDLRTQYGLVTRVTATIPVRRVQKVTINAGPLHQWLQRASVRVSTAGMAGEQSSSRDREWVAPLIRREQLPSLLGHLVPGMAVGGPLDPESVAWQRVHPRAFVRAAKPPLALAALASLASVAVLGWGAVIVLALTTAWAVTTAHFHVANLGYAADEEVVLMRSGWLWRHIVVARTNKIQVVALHESPFDRRARMARVRVDTAGAGEFSPRVDIPYLDADLARRLTDRLATRAASTALRW